MFGAYLRVLYTARNVSRTLVSLALIRCTERIHTSYFAYNTAIRESNQLFSLHAAAVVDALPASSHHRGGHNAAAVDAAGSISNSDTDEPAFLSRSDAFKFKEGDNIELPCDVINTGNWIDVGKDAPDSWCLVVRFADGICQVRWLYLMSFVWK